MQARKYWKIVTKGRNSALIRRNGLRAHYAKGEWTKAKKGTRLFVFRSRTKALRWAAKMYDAGFLRSDFLVLPCSARGIQPVKFLLDLRSVKWVPLERLPLLWKSRTSFACQLEDALSGRSRGISRRPCTVVTPDSEDGFYGATMVKPLE